MNRKLTFLVLLIILNLSIRSPSVHAAVPTELTIGGVYPLTGALSLSGVEAEAASRIAVENINKNDSILKGTTLKIVKRDSSTDPTTGATVTQELLDLGVFGIIGGESSSVSMQMAKKTQAAKVPQISYASTNVALSDKSIYPYFLRMLSPSSTQGIAIANIINEFNFSSVALLSSSDPYGLGAITSFISEANILNISIATNQTFELSNMNITSQLQNIVDSDAKVIFLNTLGSETTKVFTQAESVGITPKNNFQWFVTDSSLDQSIIDSVPEIMNGLIGIKPNYGDGPLFEKFLDLWEAADPNDYSGAGDRTSNTYAALAYDAVYTFALAADAMIKAGEDPTDGAKLLKILSEISFNGATGVISFDTNFDRNANYFIYNVQNSNLVKVGKWDNSNGMQIQNTIILSGDETIVISDTTFNVFTETVTESIIVPGYELWMTIISLVLPITILRRKIN